MNNNNDNSNGQAQQQQQNAAGAPPPNGNVLLISRPPSPIEFAPLDINAATSPPPIGEPGSSLAAWAAPYSLLHAEGATHTSTPQQEEQQQQQQQQQQIDAPPATTATAPLLTPTVISNWNNFYFYDMYRCRDDEEEDPTEGSYMAMADIMASTSARPGQPLPPPTQSEARRRLGDIYALLYLIAQIKDRAVQQGITFAEAAPYPTWIQRNIANAKMLMERFGGANAATHLNRLVVGLAKKALGKLKKMKRVGGPQQQQAEGGGTGGVGGSSSAGGSEGGGGGGDGGGT